MLFRIKPNIEAHTHEYIKTGQEDSKFGQSLEQTIVSINVAKDAGCDIQGIHAHIGSQIFNMNPFMDLIERLGDMVVTIHEACGVMVSQLNIGGGVGIKYVSSDTPFNIESYLENVVKYLKKTCKDRKIGLPKLILEPGRSIIGTAGVTLYTVGAIKEIPGIKTYLFIDGGMGDNIRPMLYQSDYTFAIANKANQPPDTPYAIAGKYCESSDILGKNINLPKAEVGDTLIVYGTGAYNYSMASNYNKSCRPAMVIVEKGSHRLCIKRETIQDLMQQDQ